MIILHHFHTLIHLYKTLQYLFLSVWIPWLSSLHLGGLGVWILSKTEKKKWYQRWLYKSYMFACTEGNFPSFGPTGNSTSTVQKKRFFQANKSVHQFVYRMNMQIYADYARHWREKWGRNDNSGFMKVHRQILTQITKQPTSVASQPAS